MKKVYVLGFMLIAVLAFQGVASAKMVSGKIAGVDAAGKKLTIDTTDPASGSVSKVDIMVSDATQYSGAKALADLKEGQEVSIDASEDATGGWSAVSVTAAGAETPAEPVKEPAGM